jgi:hypothetical protein
MVDPYQRQIAPQRVGQAVGQANAQQLGAGIGETLAGIGDMVGDNAIADLRLKQQQDEDAATFAAMPQWAEMQLRFADREQELRTELGEDYAGYREAVGKLIEEETGGLLASISNKRVRDRYAARITEFRTEMVIRADGIERGKAVKAQTNAFDRASNATTNRLGRGAPGVDLENALADLDDDLEALNVDAEAKAALRTKFRENYVVSWLSGQPPNERKAYLDKGIFDGDVSPDAMDRLYRRTDVDIRALQVEMEERQRKEASDAKTEMDRVLKDLGDGAVLPADQIDALVDRAKTLGLDKQGYDLEIYGLQNDLNRQYPPGTSLRAIEQAVMQTDAAIAKAGDNVPANLARTRDHLGKMLAARRDAMREDPLAYAATAGYQFAPLDPGDASTYAARASAALKAAAATGGPVAGYTAVEVEEWKRKVAQPNGRPALVEDALRFGDQRVVRAVIQQVAPNDPVLAHALILPSAIREAMFEGEAALRDKRASVAAADARQAWSPLRGAFPPGSAQLQSAVYQSAIRIYARDAARRGLTEFDEDLFEKAVSAAAGGQVRNGVRYGGLGEYKGRTMLLPDGMSQRDFETRLYAFKPTKAFHANGQKISGAELRDNYWPLKVGPTTYRFVNARGEYAGTAKRGEVYTLNIAMIDPPPAAKPDTVNGLSNKAAPVYRAPPQRKLPQGPVYRAAPRNQP